MPVPPPTQLRDYKFHDIEIKYGLVQLSEGLGFLHNSVKSIHRNICPENIVLNHQGAWKLFGFEFCISNNAPLDQQPCWTFEEYDPSQHPDSQPNLDYLAPEYTLTHTIDPAADMFGLGVTIYAIFNEGKPLFTNNQNFSTYQKNSCDLKNPKFLKLNNIPTALTEQVKLLLNATAQLRPDAIQFSKVPYFDDIGVKTLSYLDQMFQWDNMQKSHFYKGLPQIIPQLPHRVCLLRIVPSLMNECVNPSMVPFVLPVILLVTEKATNEDYVQYVLPQLKSIMKLTDPIQIMLQLMQKMDLLLSKTPPEDVRSDVLPLLYRALESDTQQIQELCLSVIPTCAPLVDAPTMKNSVLSRIKKLCLGTGYLSVRVNCLVCVGKLLENLDKWLIMDEIFPFLVQVPSKEAPVIMATVGILKVTLHHQKLGISKEILATRVLPFLFPLSIENSLTPAQHASIMALIREMTDKVESEHRAKLDHLNSIKDEQKSLQMNMPTNLNNSTPKQVSSSAQELDTMFNGLGLSQYVSSGGSSQGTTSPDSTGPTSPITSPQTPKTSGTSLSLEEKQRIARQQSLGTSGQNIPPLLPSPPPPAASSMKPTGAQSSPRDLTSSLISSNMNFISSPPPTQKQPSPTPASIPASVSFMNSMNTLRTLNTMGNSGAMITPSSSGWGATVPNVASVQRLPANSTSFPGLLSSPTQNRPMGLNQMGQISGIAFGTNSFMPMVPMQPLGGTMSPSSNSNSNSFKPLSSSDIKDFLS